MYKVVLADDEKWALWGLSQLVDWADYQCEIVGEANDGLAALELCRKLKPDLLITDIRMPGMDGLELARTIAMEQPRITVVLVTGYSDIAYAQTALHIGVFDYLTKQVTTEDMNAMLQRFLSSARERHLQSTSQLFFNLFGEENIRSLNSCMAELCIPVPYLMARAVTLLYEIPVNFTSSRIQEDNQGKKIVFHTGSHQLTCICFFDEEPEMNWYAELPSMEQAAQMGLSSCVHLDASFYTVYRQSELAAETARFWHEKRMITYREMEAEKIGGLLLPMQKCLQNGGTQLDRQLQQLRIQVEGMQLEEFEMLLSHCIALLAAFHVPGWELSVSLEIQQIIAAGGCCEEVFAVLDGVSQMQEPSMPPRLVEQVLAYVERNFCEELRITQLAEMFHLNANYLSTLIRKHTGKTYSEVLTSKRLAYARELLETTQMTTQEIAYKCGYHEYSHFNSLFKKRVGTTPARYRMQHSQ